MVMTSLPEIYDMKLWFREFTFGSWKQISRYRAYKIEMHADNYVTITNRQIMAGRKQLVYGRVYMDPVEELRVNRACEWCTNVGQKIFRDTPHRAKVVTLVPNRPLPFNFITRTLRSLSALQFLSIEQNQEWQRYLDVYRQEDNEQCPECNHTLTTISIRLPCDHII